MTVDTSWWFTDITHEPEERVWDVREPPVSIHGHLTSEDVVCT